MVGKLTNDEMERMWKEAVMAYFMILFWHSPEENRGNYTTSRQDSDR
jgi:hypothetical protein